ncbi:hypothetical protein [Streptomyces sp. MT206]|uniref:hypothetical protein n=1 Tax=Streptomyces sp. MT206 TaxID=3031407 RepID=UPI002FCBC31A
MPQLPYETITLRVLLPHDLDRTVAALSGRAYDARTAAGSEFQVHGNLHDAKTTRLWMARGGPAPRPQVLLNGLAHEGLIEDGDYRIKG